LAGQHFASSLYIYRIKAVTSVEAVWSYSSFAQISDTPVTAPLLAEYSGRRLHGLRGFHTRNMVTKLIYPVSWYECPVHRFVGAYRVVSFISTHCRCVISVKGRRNQVSCIYWLDDYILPQSHHSRAHLRQALSIWSYEIKYQRGSHTSEYQFIP